MKRFVSTLFVLALLFSATAFSQGWTYSGAFPDTSHKGNTHAIAVDPDGKVWFGDYYNTDSILTGAGTYAKCKDIFVYNADGSKASFSPIKTVTVGGVTDTLWNSNRGANIDQNGNILWASYNVVYRINYKTGEGMNKFTMNTFSLGCTAPYADKNGNIFVRDVAPGYPILMYDNTFNFLGNAIDTAAGYSRTMIVSPDGNTIYNVGYTNNAIIVYNRPTEFDPYTVQDTILKGFACESVQWNPATGELWASAGNSANLPNGYPGDVTSYSPQTWYAYNVTSKTITDSLKWNISVKGSVDDRPRAIAFSPNGNTAYVGCFSSAGYYVEKFTNPHPYTAVKQENPGVVANYTLSQNYPNPFNPSTEINYSVVKPGFVTLKVYDLLGKEVATLVNQNQSSGNFTVNFNANKLASGTYIYQLNVNGVVMSKKMTLLK